MTLSYTDARRRLAEVLDEATDSREPVTITRRGHEPVAVIPVAELRALQETAYLLSSPANASRLRSALDRAVAGGGEEVSPDDLAAGVGLG